MRRIAKFLMVIIFKSGPGVGVYEPRDFVQYGVSESKALLRFRDGADLEKSRLLILKGDFVRIGTVVTFHQVSRGGDLRFFDFLGTLLKSRMCGCLISSTGGFTHLLNPRRFSLTPSGVSEIRQASSLALD